MQLKGKEIVFTESHTDQIMKVGWDMLVLSRVTPLSRWLYLVFAVTIVFRIMLIYSAYLVIENATNFDMVADGMEGMASFGQGIGKIFPLLIFHQRFLKMFLYGNHLWEPDPKYDRFYRRAIRLMRYYRNLVYSTLGLYYIKSFIKRTYPFPVYVPPNSPFRAFAVYVMSFCVLSFEVMHVIGCDLIFIAVSINVIIQYKMLNKSFEELEYEGDMQSMRAKFHRYIKHHAYLLGFIGEVQGAYSTSMMFTYGLTYFGCCIEMFGIDQSTQLVSKWMRVMYMLAITIQLGLYGVPADEVAETATEASNAIYNSKWYNYDVRMQKMIPLVSARAQKDIKFKGGGLVVINRTSFTEMFKGALSVMAILKQMKEKDMPQ